MFVIINIINLVKWEFDNLVQTTVLFHEEVATRTGWPLLPDVVAPVPGRKITVIVHQIFFLPKQLTAFRNTAKNALTCCFFPINKTFCFKHIICELNLIRISAEHLKRSLCSTDNVHCAHWPFPNLFCLPLLYRVSHLTDPGQKVPKGFLISTELRVPLTVSVFNTFREVIQKNKRPL